MSEISVLGLVCTLKAGDAPSSSEFLAEQVLDAFTDQGATGSLIRVVNHNVEFGVTKKEHDDDEWPEIRVRMLDADVLLIATPIWLGQPSSVCKMVLERLDAELSETDAEGRMQTYPKVAVIAVVGNEDGAHHCVAEISQALNDVGFTLPANAATYWVGEAMGSIDYNDLEKTPEKVETATRTLAANAAHLARLLKSDQYPAAS